MALKTLRFLVFLSLVLILPPSFIPTAGSHAGSGGAILAEAIPEPELEALVAALREKGYHLFPNAIMTSDLRLRLLDGDAFTIFAPTDASLFSMDMTSASAAEYLRSLLFHVSPVRLTLSSLRSLPSPSSFPSLLDSSPHRLHHIPPSAPSDTRAHPNVVSVDGVDVLFPGIFYSPHAAVHGLDGILDVHQSRHDNLAPQHSDYDLPFPAAPSPQNPDDLANPPPEYGDRWTLPEAPIANLAPAQSPATFPEEPFHVGDGSSYSSTQASPVVNGGEGDSLQPELRCAASSTSPENCADADAAIRVVDYSGSEESGATGDGYEVAAEGEAEAGNIGEKRKRIFRMPSIFSPSAAPAVNECPAVLGEADSDARSVAAAEKCETTAPAAKGLEQDDPTVAAEDVEISYEEAVPIGPVLSAGRR